ncbi:MAG: SCO family protein [Parvibaculum sp.]
MKRLSSFSPTLVLLFLLAVAAGAAVWLWSAGDKVTVQSEAGQTGQASGTGTPSIGGPFTMTDQTGRRVTDKDFAGKYMLIYFGFTFCPDVCPTELQVMSGALDELGANAARVQPIFVTVDPERDTPEVLARYVKQFNPRLIGLTGSAQDIAAIAKEYRVYYEKVKDDSSSDDYSMDHSSIIYLMGPDGGFLSFFPPGTSPEKMAEKIKTFIK